MKTPEGWEIDEDGVIHAPFLVRRARFTVKDEVREFVTEYFNGAHGEVVTKVTRCVVRRLSVLEDDGKVMPISQGLSRRFNSLKKRIAGVQSRAHSEIRRKA